MLKLKSALISIALTATAVTATGVAAEAAPNVTIHKIAGETIAEGAKANVRPKVTRASQVKITSKTITVKNGDTTVVDRKKSARLKAGTYRVTTRVTFKTWKVTKENKREYSSARHKSRSQTLKITTEKAEPEELEPEESQPAPDCTRTSSGTCIQGGQFCPQAKYGQSGWDAAGRMYICKGDSDHPHWMKP